MPDVVYPNSPIREAVFDIRFKFEEEPNLQSIEEAFEQIKAAYPKREVTNIQSVFFEITQGSKPVVNTQGGPNGLRLTSSDKKRIVQFRADGFTYSQLKPYKKWEDFISEGRKLLAVYLEKVKPKYADRVALRYINSIDIPESNFTLEEYFQTAPKIGDDVPQGLVHFFSRVVLKDDNSESFAIVNQTIEENDKSDHTTVLFDIDVFQDNLRTNPEPKEINDIVEELKQFRTRIFQGSLTDKTKDLFS